MKKISFLLLFVFGILATGYCNSTLRDWMFNLPYRDGEYRIYTTTANYMWEDNGTLNYTGNIDFSSGTINFTDLETNYLMVSSTSSFSGDANFGDIYCDNLIADYGIASSTATFSGIVLATGIYGSGEDLTISGAGTRMFWYPKKSSFRAGSVNGTQWNDANIGNYSTAMGYNTVAVGDSATAMGRNTIASGNYSTAMGYGSQANYNYSTAMGYDTVANNYYSTAMGTNARANGIYSTAMGYNTIAVGDSATAMGYKTVASGYYSTAIGSDITSQAYISFVMGRWNEVGGNINNWIDTDPLFVIGNGTDDSNRNNALTVLKNGKMGIGTSIPVVPLQVNGGIDVGLSGGGYFVIGSTTGANIGFDNNEIMARNNGVNSTLYIQADGGTVDINGNLDVAGSKNFKIPHPNPVKRAEGWKLIHGCVETPAAGGTLYKYTVDVVNGLGNIELPDYFKYLNKDVTIFVTPNKHFGSAYGELDNTIDNVIITANEDGEYNVLILGVRKDDGVKNWEGPEIQEVDA